MTADESLVLWGRSGSGKSTLLHVLGGLLAPTSGTVEFAGRRWTTLDGGGDRGRLRAGRHRQRLPEPQPAAALHRLRERRLRGARRATATRPADGRPPVAPLDAAAPGRPRRQGRQPAVRALRRRGTARRDRPRAGAAPAPAALRRADRPPRLRHRRARPRPDRGAAARVRLRPRARHPRPRRRRALRRVRSSCSTAASSARSAHS